MQSPSVRRAFLLAAAFLSPLLTLAGSLHEEIDRAIAAKAGGPLAPAASDGEFLRRVSLDLAGHIPTSAQARDFLTDRSEGKRAALIDRLLASPEWPRRMEQAVTVMLLERRTGGKVPDEKWREWLHAQFARNRPWDELVREFFAIAGDPKASPAAKLIANEEKFDPDVATQNIGRLMLGMDLKCAQCHDHPSVAGFTQADYFGLHAFFRATKLEVDKATKQPRLLDGPLEEKIEFKSVFESTGDRTAPHLPGQPPVTLPAGEKAPGRATFAQELASPANRRFVQNAVNRFWFQFMGRGLVHPLDRLHDGNPPSHPELLDLLCREFIAHRFDVKWLVRELALSETYQRSSRAAGDVKADELPPESYRVANLKPLAAEQLAQAAMRATGELEVLEKASDAGFLLKNYVSGTAPAPPRNATNALAVFVSVFGNPAGEPEVEFAPGMSHSLFLMNDRMVLDWLKPNAHNLTGRLAKTADAQALAEELYLSLLTRPPEADEVQEVTAYLAKNAARREAALGELAWALLASTEFRLNH